MCHVLVIEDEAMIAEYVSDIATDAGATSTDIADSPAEAIASACARRPDLILSDVRIIDGTGPEAVAEILRRCGPIPVIFITATPEACEPCTYAAAVLQKPIVPAQVIRAIRAAGATP